jgi:predicted ATPase/class 3 adenylate cyclase
MSKCSSCATENPPGSAFCVQCGVSLTQRCPCCGLENPPGTPNCQHCNTSLSATALSSFQISFEGERRFATILFADIAGFTQLSELFDPEQATRIVNRCLEVMTQVVIRNGGRLDKYTGDGLMAVYGAPIAHEDDPERALITAIQLVDVIRNIHPDDHMPALALHVGLACGQVVAAAVGSQYRREYTVIGRPVNLASRLEEATKPNQILVSDELARLTSHLFQFQPIKLSALRGWDDDVSVYELLSHRHSISPLDHINSLRSPLVGREAEISTLGRSLEELLLGKGSLIHLVGEVGMGKSRLLREMHIRVNELQYQVDWLQSSAPEKSENIRYCCIQKMIRTVIGASAEADEVQVTKLLQNHLAAILPEKATDNFPYLAQIIGIRLPDVLLEQLDWLDDDLLRWQIMRVTNEWISALATQKPVVLIFDDFQWVDQDSVEIFESLCQVVENLPVMIVLSYRPEPDEPVWHFRKLILTKLTHYSKEINLKPLSISAIQEIVQNLLGTRKIPDKALELIITRSEGNPLFIEEIVRSMLDNNILIKDAESNWQLVLDWSEIGIPENIQGILQARVDRLDRETRRILQIAACLGRRFNIDPLSAIAAELGITESHIANSVRILLQTGLIHQNSEQIPQEYEFRHILIQDTVYRSLLHSSRAYLHSLIAAWYENHSKTGEPPGALLAFHYEQTDDVLKQLQYFSKAGFQALCAHANNTALNFFNKALNLVSDSKDRFDLLIAREKVCQLLGDYQQQGKDLEELLQLVAQIGDDQQRAFVYNRLAIWHETQGEYDMARLAFERCLAAARRANDNGMEAESLYRIASASWRQGRYNEALELGRSALTITRKIHDTSREAESLTTLGVIYRTLGDLGNAQDCYTQAFSIHKKFNDQRGIAINLSQLGNIYQDQGAYTEAHQYHLQALSLFRQVGDRRGEAWSLSGLGTVNLRCGFYDIALEYAQQALEIRTVIGDRRGEGVALSDAGSILLDRGQPQLALEYLEKANKILSDLGARRDEIYARTSLAQCLEQLNELSRAAELHQSAFEERSQKGQVLAGIDNLAGLGRISLQNSNVVLARTYAGQILAHIETHGLAQSENPGLIYRTLLQIFQASGEQKSVHQILKEANDTLLERASRITDPELRRSFMEAIPNHRLLLEEWKRVQG